MSDQVNKNKDISSKKYIAPEYKKSAFHCPHCGIYAKQNWFVNCTDNIMSTIEKFEGFLKKQAYGNNINSSIIDVISEVLIRIYNEHSDVKNSWVAFCDHCKKYSIWVDQKIVYPDSPTAPLPVEDMPESVKKIYNEARDIVNKSSRGACALLRLAIQRLMKELGEDENNLNKAIGNLVKKGLPKRIQEALDYVRVTGNKAVHQESVHSEKINIQDTQDDQEIAGTLFMLVNFICEKMITEEKKVNAMYSSLSSNKIKAIENRDNTVNDNKGQ